MVNLREAYKARDAWVGANKCWQAPDFRPVTDIEDTHIYLLRASR